MRTLSLPITTTGGAGVATGAGQLGVGDVAEIRGVVLAFAGTAPASTVVTLTNQGRTVFTSTGNTSKLFPVVEQAFDTAGVAIAAGQSPRYVPPLVHGTIAVAVTVSNALAPAVTVAVLVED